jgi:hypothetical protein
LHYSIIQYYPILSNIIQDYPILSKMAQYIRIPCEPNFNNVSQVCQCAYHNERVFEIYYDNNTRRILIQEYNNHFWLTSPDIENITIYQVLEALGYINEQIVVTWSENNINDSVLNSTVEHAPLSQISIYPASQSIPLNHYQGPLPNIPGEPVDILDSNNPNNLDDSSTISDTQNSYILEQLDDPYNE